MATIILGSTPCGICGRTLLKGDEVRAFSPFVANEADPLHFFSDGAFHEQCFAGDARAREATNRLEELRAHTGPGKRKCRVCGDEIRNPDDYLSFGYIADHPPAVSSLNYLQFHRQHLRQWAELSSAHQALVELEKSGTWKGPGLRWLVEQLQHALTSR